MGVQTFATERNSQVELLIHFILEEYFNGLQAVGEIKELNIEMQRQYVSEIASDIWDHHISFIQSNGREIEIWCQTTCYKGNGTGVPEPNKTYEVRETLVEGLSIRQMFKNDATKDFRSIHFTVGDSAYTYKWFMELKASVFDKSIYIGTKGYDIFKDINALFSGNHTEISKRTVFKNCISSDTDLGHVIQGVLKELNSWWNIEAHKSSIIGNLQWGLIERQLIKLEGKWPDFTKVKGEDIKGRTNALIFAEEPATEYNLIRKTAVKLLAKNPFLSTAIEMTNDWNSFIIKFQEIASKSRSLEDLIALLWNYDLPQRLVLRRLLLRIHSMESVKYVQDVNIDGVTEHGIYSKDYNQDQVKKITEQILKNLKDNGISHANELIDQLKSIGKKLINQSRWFEAKNGTELKPSFDYVEIALEENGYYLITPSKAKLNVIGYHADISSENVRPYTNLKAIVNHQGNVLAIIKAKFFRAQEFPRRCKEEAFVGLTLRNTYKNGAFHEKTGIPLIMYVDMAVECAIPEHAIKRLICFGWHPVFSIQELISYLLAEEPRNDE
jgi:hypothetical protein